ncbi:hypothetical protein CDL15_Pgr015580 [Punica granatum]|uniref:PGG domain-containing protein n=1 Tax=Punica granatum TaxID=22663 RepID=A0A218XMR6_PUNGR|nr:hypothetical protein CDL15_Pgr015580 [Punica granatum]
MMHFLIRSTEVEVHSPNLNGFTAFNILARIESPEEEQSMVNNIYLHIRRNRNVEDSHVLSSESDHHALKPPEEKGWLEEKKSALMVVASLIATMAFQASISPPGGVWEQDGSYHQGSAEEIRYYAGTSRMAYSWPLVYLIFIIVNTIGFVAAMSIILLLISGIPLLMRRAFMWVYMVIMWVAVSSVSLVYTTSLSTVTPTAYENNIVIRLLAILQIWSFLMLLLLPGHLIHLVVKFIWRKIIGPRSNNHTSGA